MLVLLRVGGANLIIKLTRLTGQTCSLLAKRDTRAQVLGTEGREGEREREGRREGEREGGRERRRERERGGGRESAERE